MQEAPNGHAILSTSPPHPPRREFHNDLRRYPTSTNGETAVGDLSSPSLTAVCADVHGRVARLLDDKSATGPLRSVQEQLRVSMRVIEEALERYTPEHLSISYNGGKDCLVLLIIYLAGLYRYHSKISSKANGNNRRASSPPKPSLHEDDAATVETIYIQPEHPFAEVDDFVEQTAEEYRLALTVLRLPMKAAFTEYLELRPAVEAIFVGTRRTDPHGASLTHFDATTNDWPTFMRIHPVVDWHYQDIWTFIRHLNIPYCPLYDQGFTSLGGIYDTFPNPALRAAEAEVTADGQAVVKYRPAYELTEDSEERLGRDRGAKGA